MIRLPADPTLWPLARILVRTTWGANDAAGTGAISAPDWEILPALARGRDGYELLELSRHACPMAGEATFRYRFGLFAHGIVGAVPDGTPWDPASDTVQARDFRGYEIRIQMAPAPEESADTPAWRTVWWGSCEHWEDTGHAGASIPAGERTYYCVDGLQRMRNWEITRHGMHAKRSDSQERTFPPEASEGAGALGAMPYNLTRNSETIGNKDSDLAYYKRNGVTVFMHALPAADNATTWTDAQALAHALDAARPKGEPSFPVDDKTDTLDATWQVWDVPSGTTALDMLHRICDRRRGRGVAVLEWADDSANPTGPLTIGITVYPQLPDTLTIPKPSSGSDISATGADAAGTSIDYDIIGDHRIDADSTRITGRGLNAVDYLETRGERIEVAVTGRVGDYADGGSYDGHHPPSYLLRPGWSEQQEADYLADTSGINVYDAVFRNYSLAADWQGKSGNGNGGKGDKSGASVATRCDYRCDDDGEIVVPSGDPDTDPAACEILPDLPFLEGYAYYFGPTPTASDLDDPPRRPINVMLRYVLSTDDKGNDVPSYLPGSGPGGRGAQVHVDGPKLKITFPDSDPSVRDVVGVPQIGSDYHFHDLTVTFALRLPHHVRMASGDPDGRRVRVINLRDVHLWLAHPGCIYATTGDDDMPLRDACRGLGGDESYGIIRDDRDRLAFAHALAWRWYGSSDARQADARRRAIAAGTSGEAGDVLSGLAQSTTSTCAIALRCCGLFPSFQTMGEFQDQPQDVSYPRLGQLIRTLSMNGQRHQINTPITSLTYDHQSGLTTWTTDWQELDYAQG